MMQDKEIFRSNIITLFENRKIENAENSFGYLYICKIQPAYSKSLHKTYLLEIIHRFIIATEWPFSFVFWHRNF